MKRRQEVRPARERARVWASRAREAAGLWAARLGEVAAVRLAAVRRHYRGLTFRQAALGLVREVFANPRLGRAGFALVVLTWSTLIVWGRFIVPLATTPYFRPSGRFQVIGFFENGTGPQFVDSFPTLEKYAGLFDTVSPFWYSVGPTGDISGNGYRAEVVAFARSRRLKVIPLVNNLKEGPGNAWDAIRTPQAREKTVANLSALATSQGFDGLNISFELMPAEARLDYALFVKDLAAALHVHGLSLAVSVFPDVEVPPQVSGFFDYAAIGGAADYVVLTAYDRHWTNTGPGPIAPLTWVEASIDSLLTHVPARKVILGIGTHAYDWPVEEGAGITEYLPTNAALARAEEAGAAVQDDPASRQRFFTYQAATGIQRQVWLEDAPHLADKASLARRKGLRGVAVWRLGFSEPGALELFGRTIGRRP